MAQRRAGTSGWSYKHWRGVFYPEDLAQGRELEYYTTVFDTVELNSSCYHIPKPITTQEWYERTLENFLFAIKGSRFIPHRKKLADCEEPLQRITQALEPLREKLGPILWQLSPGFHQDISRRGDFLTLQPADQRWAWEFRHKSWFCDEVYSLLEQHNCALVWGDTPKYPLETVVTAELLMCPSAWS